MAYTNSINHPDCFNPFTKRTKVTNTYLDSINQSLRNLLLTSRGELLGDPNYGTDLMKFIYDNNNLNLNEGIKEDIARQVKVFEPRVLLSSDKITFVNIGRQLYITLEFLIKKTDEIVSLELFLRNIEE